MRSSDRAAPIAEEGPDLSPQKRERQGLRTAWDGLIWVSAVVITVTGVAAKRMNGVSPVDVRWAVVLLGLITLGTMWLIRPRLPARCVRALQPVVLLTAVTAAVWAITAWRMGNQRMWGFLTMAMAPFCWSTAAILGYASVKRRIVPLLVVGAAVWISAVAGLVQAVQRAQGVGLAAAEFRAVGLDTDPNHYSLIAVVALVFVMSLEGSPRVRGVIAAGAVIVLYLSGSRSGALAAAAALVAWIVPSLLDRPRLAARARQLIPVGAGVLSTAVVLGVATSMAGSPDLLFRRLTGSVGALTGGVQQGGLGAAVNAASNARVEMWVKALALYREHPMGVFLQLEALLGRSVHNEFLARLALGGPLYLAVFLFALGWLFVKVRPAGAPAFGPMLCAAWAAAAMALEPSWTSAFAILAAYLVGWARAQQDLVEAKNASRA